MLSLARWCRTRSNEATPLSSQATASPSMMQERGAQACQGLDNQREAAGEIVARTAVKPHPRASLARNDAEAVVLDLMQPLAAGWQLIGFAWEARRDEPGREGRLQHAAPRKIRTDCLARFVLPFGTSLTPLRPWSVKFTSMEPRRKVPGASKKIFRQMR